MSLREFFWPMLEPASGEAIGQAAARMQADRDDIDLTVLRGNLDTILDEARRLFDAEAERRRTAENRATFYITAVGVLIPILASIAPAVIDPKKAVVLPVITLVMFGVATAYLVAGIYWAFKTLSVAKSATLSANELAKIGGQRNSESRLIKGLLNCIRYNYPLTNQKVDAAKMSREFALRAGITFALAILIKSAWAPAAEVLGLIFK
jgi:hypothetical protein